MVVVSSLMMVPSPVVVLPSPTSVPVGFLINNLTISSASTSVSPKAGTVCVLVVSPAAKLTVATPGVKSERKLAVPSLVSTSIVAPPAGAGKLSVMVNIKSALPESPSVTLVSAIVKRAFDALVVTSTRVGEACKFGEASSSSATTYIS